METQIAQMMTEIGFVDGVPANMDWVADQIKAAFPTATFEEFERGIAIAARLWLMDHPVKALAISAALRGGMSSSGILPMTG